MKTKIDYAIKEIPGFEGYLADTEGNIYSDKKFRTNKRIKLKPCYNKKGYLRVNLTEHGKGKVVFVHRLVLITFVGTKPQGMQACHNNRKRDDNRLENLRWDTQEGNQADRHLHGTDSGAFGEKNGKTKLNELQVRIIKRATTGLKRRRNGMVRFLAGIFNVTDSAIQLIKDKRNWSYMEN